MSKYYFDKQEELSISLYQLEFIFLYSIEIYDYCTIMCTGSTLQAQDGWFFKINEKWFLKHGLNYEEVMEDWTI